MTYTRDQAIRVILDDMYAFDTVVDEVSETYIIFAGNKEDSLKPVDASETKAYARQVAKDAAQAYPYVEVFHMPDNKTSNLVAKYTKGKKIL